MIMLGATPSETQYGPEPPLTEGLSERLKLWDLDPADFEDRALEASKSTSATNAKIGLARAYAL